MDTAERQDLIGEVTELYRDYYRDAIGELAQHYPTEQQALYIEAKDLYRKAPWLLERYQEESTDYQAVFESELANFDIPADVDLSGARVRLTDSHEYLERKGLGELTQSDLGRYIAIRCQIGKVSERKPRLKVGVFKCNRCGSLTEVPQQFSEGQEPHQCQGCERSGPFTLDENKSEWVDQRKLLLEAPPENQSGAELVSYCLADMADPPDVEILDKAGSRVTVLGKLEADKSSLFGRGQEPVADEYFVPHAFVWGNNLTNEVDIDEYRSEVQEYASRDNAIEIFKENIDPGLVVTDAWEQALEMAVPWLFGAPRIPRPNGPPIRGDIHMLFVSDPGMNKSDFANQLAELSPKALKKDSEGMSSEVALTAAATRGGFGDDSWSIDPGALPKANKGHLILDEIDKGPDGFLSGIHSPLEGEQMLRVEKAGQEANLATRCGFLALGNPTEGRFDPYEPIAEQVDLHPALMSRFDLICTMQDKPDEETDGAISGGMLNNIDESARVAFGGLDPEDADTVSGDIPRKVMQAWVKLAREEIEPLLTDEAKEVLKEFYVSTRQLNDDESEKPPATARTLVGGVRIAMAFARCELSDTVAERHANRAINLSRTIVGKNFDPSTGEFDANRTTETPSSQEERVNAIKKCIFDEAKEPEVIAEETGLSLNVVENRIEKLQHRKGLVVEPTTGKYKWVK